MNIGSASQPEINVTPLIDVLLVLLIIFMLIDPQKPTGLSAQIPQPANPAQPRSSEPDTAVIVALRKQGSATVATINRQPVSIADLKARLTDIMKLRAQHIAFLTADAELDFDQIAQVLDTMHDSGVDRVGLLTAKLQ